jgi:phosphoesterase RecJ-like protein
MTQERKSFMETRVDQIHTAISRAWILIQQAQKITLLTHRKPDADGISACAAFSSIFEKMGKQVEAIYLDEPEFPLKRSPSNILIGHHSQVPDLLIACDTANYDRLYFPDIFRAISLINIDHHVSNRLQGVCNIIDTTVSSTCELLYDLLCVWDKTVIDTHVAECLMMGILYDSQVFHTQATTPKTLRVAGELIELGANLFQLKTELLCNKSPDVITLWGEILLRIQISPTGNAAWVGITQQDLKKHNLTLTSLLGFSNFLWEISGVDITLVFYEMESGETKVSLRSKKSDVNELASRFGGGGHKNASGILSNRPIYEFMRDVTKNL